MSFYINNNTNRRRVIGFGLLGALMATVAGLVLSNIGSNFILSSASENTYQLVLDKDNAVGSSGTTSISTKSGGKVDFTYSGTFGNSSGNHTKLYNGATIVNKDIIHSISGFRAVFSGSGTLKARTAYVTSGDKWSDYFELVSGQAVSLEATKPYFLEIKCFNNTVDLESAEFTYTCQVNQDAETQDTSGSYEITFKATGSDSSSDIGSSSSSIMSQVDSGSSFISSFSSGSKIYAGKSGLKFGSSSAAGSLTINFSSAVEFSITTIDIATAQYGTDTGNFRVYVNGSSSYTQITPSDGGSVNVNGTLTSLEIETTTKRAYLCGLTLNYGQHVDPGTPDAPVYETGFSASDSNKDTYTTNSIFANENNLVVEVIFSDASRQNVEPGNYSYVIVNSLDLEIDPNVKFPAEGIYTLRVSYNSYIPVEITLNVGEYVYPTDVSASMTNTTFNTADVLANNLAGNLVANVEYSDDTTSSDIAYSDFASRGIGMYLLTPKGITYDIDKPFGVAGTWTVKVFSLDDEDEMFYNISLTVNAVPVQTISLNETSYTLTPEDTLQLVASVNPTYATNSAVVWASNNDEVATVDENGLVAAVAVGGATITATAADGSNVYGSCVITVNAKPVVSSDTIIMSEQGFTSEQPATNISGTNYSITWDKGTNNNAPKYYSNGSSVRVYGSNSFTVSSSTLNIVKIELTFGSNDGSNEITTDKGSYSSGTWTGNATSVEFTVGGTSGNRRISSIKITYEGAAASPVYPTSISLSGTNSIAIGSTSQLEVAYTPSDTNVKNVTFSSNKTNIATVSNTGLVTGVAQGSATITATAEAASGTVSTTYDITVTPIAVTSVTLDASSASVKVGKTITLVATVNPNNATNKNVTWTSSSTSVATVSSSGVVTGVAAGQTTITVRTTDGNKTATCVVTVTASGGEESFEINYGDLPTTYQTGTTVYTADSGIKFQAYNCANYSSKMQFRASSGYLQNTEDLELQSITINDRESNTLTVYGSNTAGSFSTEITGNDDVYDLTGYSYFKIARTASGAAYCSSITIMTGTPTPTDPTSIIMSNTTAEIGIGGSKQLSVSYVPSNANQNKQVTWTSSNTNVATVSSEGLVSVKSTATAGQTATITARLTNITTIYATCTITVVEQKKDDHTVLIYICGADLESENGLASGDIQEILKVSGQPDDVNIVIETGGASSWASTYDISSTKLERWHVENKSIVKDASLTYASMGLASTLQSFLEYGLNNYPAERTGLILWNHGGGMRGVCYDEKKSDDSLLNNEVKSAVSGALNNCGMSGQKLEWIGYDACLMSVQDIAEFNSAYFNYQISSEESEAGYGWDYDNWVDDLYAKKTTPVILKAICDSFISDNGGVNSSSGDQTLSYLDLSKMSAYRTAWENMASQLQNKLTSSNKSTFNNAIINNVKHFADSDYDYFCLFDAKDFINKLASASAFSSFRIDSKYTTAVLNAFADLVAYSTAQKGAGNAYGLCMYWCNNSKYSDMSFYTTSQTNFTTWRSINNTYGTHI